jgi:hypothetical protein
MPLKRMLSQAVNNAISNAGLDVFSDAPAFMRDLPMAVKTMRDARHLLRIYDDIIGSKKDYENLLGVIGADELLYVLMGSAKVTITNVQTGARINTETTGIVFASTERFLFQATDTIEIIECPIGEIHSVAKQNRGGRLLDFDFVSFSTPTMRFEFQSCGGERVRDALLHIAVHGAHLLAPGQGAAPPRVVECTGCAASVIVAANAPGKCDYCGRNVS